MMCDDQFLTVRSQRWQPPCDVETMTGAATKLSQLCVDT